MYRIWMGEDGEDPRPSNSKMLVTFPETHQQFVGDIPALYVTPKCFHMFFLNRKTGRVLPVVFVGVLS